MFEQSKGGELSASKTEVEQHLKSVYSRTEAKQRKAVALPPMKRPTAPGCALYMSDITIEEVQCVARKARTASAPGMNALPYKLYKKCERVVAILTSLLNKLWKAICLRIGVRQIEYIYPRKSNPLCSLLNVKGKIYFSVLAKRLTRFLMDNGFTEGRRTRFSRVSGTCQHDLERNSGYKEWKA